MAHSDGVQVLQIDLQRTEDGCGGDKTQTLGGIEHILGTREVVILVGMESSFYIFQVFALQSLKAVDDPEVSGEFMVLQRCAV